MLPDDGVWVAMALGGGGEPGSGSGEGHGVAAASEPEVEHDEFNAGVADSDMFADTDMQVTSVEIGLRKNALGATRGWLGECRAQIEELRDLASSAAREARLLKDVIRMEAELDDVVRRQEALVEPPGCRLQACPVPRAVPLPRGVRGSGLRGDSRFSLRGGASEAQEDAEAAGGPSETGRAVVAETTSGWKMFSSLFWSSFTPRSFPYGDGVFGIQREAPLEYPSWFDKEQGARVAGPAVAVEQAPAPLLPWWRADRDLQQQQPPWQQPQQG